RNFPMVNVTFEMATAYCAFVGRRLPTELEWEYVMNLANKESMNSDDRPRYIWGANATTCQGEDWVVGFCNPAVLDPREVGTTTKDQIDVGNNQIVYDMVGNVSEWVSDDYLKTITCKQELTFDKNNLASSQCPDYFSCAAKSPVDFDCLARSIACSNQCDDNGTDICYRAKGTSCCPFQDKPDDCRAICIPYGPTEVVEPGTSTSFRPGTQNAGLYKGASYATGTKCELRYTTRGTISKSKADNQRRKDLGFRCASDTAP
ncbi:MAG: SUMF1/EgtB/PvdO family nonheme iron enzyme, partial [Myxococcales bacterium]|nr:SUMF1/EgtB/PvdO family nonheme iron enzyme [Myxococcales bacterium]